MEIQRLPLNIAQQIIKLTADPQFNQKCSKDEKLDQINDQKQNQQIQFLQLQLLLNKKIKLFGIDFNPITIALLSYLYAIRSPAVMNKTDMTVIDLNIFFYLLQTKDYNSDVSLVLQNSMNYCERVLKLNLEQAISAFNKMYKVQLRVLSMFPSRSNGNNDWFFNLNWALSLVGNVKGYTSYSTEQLYKDISIMQVYYYYADYCRNSGTEAIIIKAEDQILFEEDRRLCQLVLELLAERNIIKNDQVGYYLNLMTAKSQENK